MMSYSLLFLALASCQLAAGIYLPTLPLGVDPFPKSAYCSLPDQFSTWINRGQECCEQARTGSSCCNLLYGFVSNGVKYYDQDYIGCRCSSASVDCSATTTTTTATTSTSTPTTTTTTPTTTTTTTPTTATTTTTITTDKTTTTTPTTATTTTTPTTTTTTTPTTTTTTTPTTTTTTPTTTTTTTPTTTTTTPTTTTTTPTTTTTTPTTTTTTTTTTAGRITGTNSSLCASLNPGNRLLNSQQVINTCTYAGIAEVRLTVGTDGFNDCNAVYTVATVNGVKQFALVTAQGCITDINEILGLGTLPLDLRIGNPSVMLPIPAIVTPVSGSNGLGYLTYPARYNSLFANLGCQEPACSFSRSMERDIDYTDCRVVSWGASNADTRVTGEELREVSVHLSNFCNPEIEESADANVICFVTAERQGLICAADKGAPVYCKAKSNGEDILIGVVGSMTEDCSGDDGGEIGVIPVSSD